MTNFPGRAESKAESDKAAVQRMQSKGESDIGTIQRVQEEMGATPFKDQKVIFDTKEQVSVYVNTVSLPSVKKRGPWAPRLSRARRSSLTPRSR